MTCPDDTTVSLYVGRGLPPDGRQAVEAHVDACADCRQLVSDLARGTPADRPSSADLTPRPIVLAERYELVRVVGAGGMGIVHEAHDSVLQRRIAIKVLHDVGGTDGRARLIREAQAMAQVSSPYVVGVYDVGTVDGQVFVSMEFVEGVTLRTWLRAQPRDWRAIVGMLEQAGRGLAAAHARGIVHRDFKPDNVLIDGHRGRVADFGLASSMTAIGPAELDAASAAPLDEPLTLTGATVGTPAYMAPEQLAGEPADARSDQFSFCVTLYEALYNRRPFAGDSFAELSREVLAGRARPPAAASPTWLRAAIMRGLAREPSARHPSMTALLDTLARARSRRVRTALALGAVAAVAVGSTVALTREPRADECGGGDDAVASIWNHGRAGRVRSALVTAGVPDADRAAARIGERLDSWRGEWVGARRDACEATRVRGEQSEALLDLRIGCLQGRAVAVDTLITLFEHADRTRFDQVAQSIGAATSLVTCRDAKALMDPMRPPVDQTARARFDAARLRVDEADVRRLAGDFATATAIATEVRAEADALAHPALAARAAMILGFGEDDDLERQEQLFDEARRLAETAADDRTRIEAGLQLVQVWEARGKAALVDSLLRDLDAVVVRIGDPLDLAAHLAYQRGRVEAARIQFDAARASTERAIELQHRVDGPNSLAAARMRGDLAMLIAELGDIDAGIRISGEVLGLLERELGPSHPWVTDQVFTRGQLAQADQQWELARDDLRRAVAGYAVTHGPEGVSVARPLAQLGVVLSALHQTTDALAALDRATAIFDKHLGPDVADTGVARVYRAQVLFDAGETRQAEAEYAAGLAIIAKARGEEDPIVANLRTGRASKRFAAGNVTGAIADLTAAIAVLQPVLGDEGVVDNRIELAQMYLAAGRSRDAVRTLEAVLVRRDQLPTETVAAIDRTLEDARGKRRAPPGRSRTETGSGP